MFKGILSLLTAALVFAALSASAEPQGPVILTVSGAITEADRGAVDPAEDKFFTYQEDDFAAAKQFDHDALRALSMVEIRADFPKDGPMRTFEGPLLADVLKAAGAAGANITLKALDGYAVEAPVAELIADGAVLALKRDGQPFAIGDYGPAQIVFPRAERAELADMPDDRWVWSVYHIHVD